MIVTVSEQRIIEARAVRNGVSLSQLMENAGREVFSYIKNKYRAEDASVTVLCGNGGNGGDGMVAARLLKGTGARVRIVICSGTPKSSAPLVMYRAAVSEGVPVLDAVSDWSAVRESVSDCDIIIDAVYGIGFHGNLNETAARLFAEVNSSRAKVIALDIPSGVNADTGEAADGAAEADETLCFIAKKPAAVFKSAGRHCGRISVLDIGVPVECFSDFTGALTEIDETLTAAALSPRPPVSHKGAFGHLLLTAGSDGYRGAAALAALGAYYAGAGLVTVASSEKVLSAVAAGVPEAVLFDVDSGVSGYEKLLLKADACLIGCGLSKSKEALRLLEITLKAECPLVIDADGLNLMAENPRLFESRRGKTVITPHVGEFSRLTGVDAAEISTDRVKHARVFAEKTGYTVVLKSENTVIASGGRTYINTAGNSGLAKAGSGDLLSGVIAALLAMGKPEAQAAAAGTWLHSAAADIAAKNRNPHSVTASYVARFISDAYGHIFSQKESE